MLTVYAIPVSLYCAKLRILLRHKKLAWQELPPPGGYGSDEYKKIVASGNLPALLDGELMIADSEAIAEYLNEKFPDAPMLPVEIDKRARVRERSRFHDTRLEPEVRALFAYIAPDSRSSSVVEVQSKAISARLREFSTMHLEPRSGTREILNLGDCGYPITFAWIDALTQVLGLSVEWPDSVSEYRINLARHRAVAQELHDYAPKLENWLTSLDT